MLHAFWMAAFLAAPTLQVDWRPVPEPHAVRQSAFASSSTSTCDDGTAGGTLVERQDAWYGNMLETPCAGARVTGAELTHFGYGLPGPYAFRLHLLDAHCIEKGVTPVLSMAGAPDVVTTEHIDLNAMEWCVQGVFQLLLEPLTCADGTTAHDCFPALVVDASSDGDPSRHCAIVSAIASDGRACFRARSADGRYFDFALRAQLDCAAPECETAVAPATWGQVKTLFRDF